MVESIKKMDNLCFYDKNPKKVDNLFFIIENSK